MESNVLLQFFRRLTSQSPKEDAYAQQWSRGTESQHDEALKAAYFPVPEEVLELSNAQYFNEHHESVMFKMFNRHNQKTIFPIRALYATGSTFLTISDEIPANPTLAVEAACRFRLDAMEAALSITPSDLLILLNNLPKPDSWEQNPEWLADEFQADLMASHHSLNRHAAALFIKRIDTPEADFLAFKEVAILIRNIGLFSTATDEYGTLNQRLGFVISDLFPSIRKREKELLERKYKLTWVSEGEEAAPVVPEDKIGRG